MSLVPPNAMSRGNIAPVHALLSLLPTAAQGNLFFKCWVSEWGLQWSF